MSNVMSHTWVTDDGFFCGTKAHVQTNGQENETNFMVKKFHNMDLWLDSVAEQHKHAGRGSGSMFPWENFVKSVKFGDFWHIFMQHISCSESIIFQQAKS